MVNKMGEILYRKSIVFGIAGLFVMMGVFPMAFGMYSDIQYSTSIYLVDEKNDFTVTITKPRAGYYYKNDVEQRKNIIDDERPHIIGPITVEASVTGGEGGIREVVFLLNDMEELRDNTAPYSWTWDYKLAIGENVVKVRAYDNNGNVAEVYVTVLILQIKND